MVGNATVPISSGLLHDIDGYIAALTTTEAGRPTAIVERFSRRHGLTRQRVDPDG
ncbi:hypothetical protein QJS66_12110 [Kocuria rhizophila]|nr:hypothetical protein QJS66_12110 [Kocuria rhizophila]